MDEKQLVHDTPGNSLVLAEQTEQGLQKQYIQALIQRQPGLGDRCQEIAQSFIDSGLAPSEAYMIMDIVYAPSSGNMAGRGQGTRMKHFAEAIQNRYGETVLHNASQHIEKFRGLLEQIGQAVEMRDMLNGALNGSSLSFSNALLFQEIGLDYNALLDIIYEVVDRQQTSELSALVRVTNAAKKLSRTNNFCTLEGVLFAGEDDQFTREVMANEKLGLSLSEN